jgi:hypothetical protein
MREKTKERFLKNISREVVEKRRRAEKRTSD